MLASLGAVAISTMASVIPPIYDQLLPLSVDLYRILVRSSVGEYTDPTQLLPQLLDQLIALGDMARQLSQALGGNGHRPEKAAELIQELTKGRG